MDKETTISTEEENHYLALRDAKIRRNNLKLQKLGLTNAKNETIVSNDGKKKKRTSTIDIGYDGDNGRKKIPVSRSPLRRSSRNKLISSVEKSDELLDNETTTYDGKGTKRTTKKRQRIPMSDNNTIKKVNIDLVRSEAKPGTTRATTIDIQRVLQGDFNYPIFIGHQLANTGKAAVVEHANLMCRNNVGISFNKYSGVCEWSNEAIFLWVNINAPNADVKNEFFFLNNNEENGSIQMSWFGGSKQKEESPIIQNLIKVGCKAAKLNIGGNRDNCASSTLSNDCGIVLWCRYYDETKKTFEPYVCLGRLSYHSHDPNVKPVKFIWNLIDYEIIKQNEHAFQTFQKFVDA